MNDGGARRRSGSVARRARAVVEDDGHAPGYRESVPRACRMTSATTSGWVTMTMCDDSASVMVAPARCAMRRTTSLPAALSPVATTAQEGRLFQAGVPLGWLKPRAE